MARQVARMGQHVTPHAGDALPSLGGPLAAADALTLKRMAVAKQFPRDENEVRRRLKAMAPAKSEDWGFAWPVKNKRTGKTDIVAGPTIKCANAVLQATPNYDTRVAVVETDDAWIFEVHLLDLETNNLMSRAYRQRREQDIGGYDDGRKADMLFAMGQSKAIRNAVVNYLSELVDFAYDESRKSLLDAIRKDGAKFRTKIAERLGDLGVNPERVVQWIGRGTKQWTVEDLAKITGVLTAIAEGVTTPQAVWPDRTPAPPAPPPPPRKREEPPPNEPPPDDEGAS